MELTFLGTRGEIKVRSRRHWRHSALLVRHNAARIMIDCGADWLGRLGIVAPTAIVLTHAHLDHAGGLAEGAACPVFATKETFHLLRRFPIRDRRRIPLRKSVVIGGVSFAAFPVQHSIRAPAVGYRVSTKRSCFFYVPDVAHIPNASTVLRGIDVYIGDGATMRRSMVRLKTGALIGHAPIAAQLSWCEKAGVHRAIFTHCGSPIVRSGTRVLDRPLRDLGRNYDMDVNIARDGDQLFFQASSRHRMRHG